MWRYHVRTDLAKEAKVNFPDLAGIREEVYEKAGKTCTRISVETEEAARPPRVGLEVGQEVRGRGHKEDNGLGLTQRWVQSPVLPPTGFGWPGKLLHGLPW